MKPIVDGFITDMHTLQTQTGGMASNSERQNITRTIFWCLYLTQKWRGDSRERLSREGVQQDRTTFKRDRGEQERNTQNSVCWL